MASPGPGRLFRRQLLADRGAAITVAVVVLVVAALLAAWPRAIDHTLTEEIREQVAQGSPRGRDVSGQVPVLPPGPTGPSIEFSETQLYGQFERTLRRIGDDAPDRLRGVLAEPSYQVIGEHRDVLDHVPASYNLGIRLAAVADPAYQEQIRIVEGALPAGIERAEANLDEHADDGEQRDSDRSDVAPAEWELPAVIVDIALSEVAAERLEWPLDQRRQLHQGVRYSGPPVVARLAGIFEAAEPEADYWAHNPELLRPFEERHAESGVRVWASGFVAPTAIAPLSRRDLTAHVTYPLLGARLTAADAPALLGELRAFTAESHPIGLGDPPPAEFTESRLRLSSGTIGTLADALNRQTSATALLALVAAGPFGVAMAVLALGSRLMIARRRRAMSVVTARGAAPGQLRIILATEGALLGLPAAVLAIVAVDRLVPGSGGAAGVVLPLAVGLAPAVLLPLIARPGAPRDQRTDLHGRRRGWLRWGLETLAIGAAGTAAVLLNRRGLIAGGPGTGVDPLLVATPLLVALAVGVLVLRLYPLPVAALGRLLARRPGLVGFVGTVRVVRDPAAGLAPVLALVVGLSVAVFSTVLWSTTQAGGASASVYEVGADLRATGPIVAPEQVEAAAALPGVSSVVAVTDQGRAQLTIGDRRVEADIFVTDTAQLAEVQAGLTGVAPIAAGLEQLRDDGLPVMMSAELAATGDTGHLDLFGGVDIAVAGVADRIAGLSGTRPWVLADGTAVSSLSASFLRAPRTLLISTDGMAADESLIAEVVDPQARVESATDVLAEVRAGPLGGGLMASFAGAVAAVGILSAVAVLLTVVIAAPSRDRLFSQLRTLGLSGRQAQGLVTWEMAPLALVALTFGSGLGIGIPWMVFSAIDLRPLTGTTTQPPITVDWTLVATAAGGFAVVVGIAIAIAAASSRRLGLGTVLRVGEEL